MMNISEIEMKKLEDTGPLKAVVSVYFEDKHVVKNIRIVENSKDPNKLFVRFPMVPRGDDKGTIIFDIVDPDLKKEFITTLLKIYNSNNEDNNEVGYKYTVIN